LNRSAIFDNKHNHNHIILSTISFGLAGTGRAEVAQSILFDNSVFNSIFIFVQQLQVMPHEVLLAINDQNNNLIPMMTNTLVQICFNILIIFDGHILILL
jgi:hypothetical protein